MTAVKVRLFVIHVVAYTVVVLVPVALLLAVKARWFIYSPVEWAAWAATGRWLRRQFPIDNNKERVR